ncbi:hypothetical protein BH11PLA2_BH11PLA2_46890 [soil metagenome]
MFTLNSTLGVEELGARIAPSVKFTIPSLTVAPPIVRHNHAAVEGISAGTFTQTIAPADTGTRYQLNGRANAADLGPVTVSGSLNAVGFIASGRAHGMLTFTNARGSVTVELTGLNEQPGNSTLPKYFRYTIVSTSGYYQHFQGQHGTARIDLHATSVGNTFRIVI